MGLRGCEAVRLRDCGAEGLWGSGCLGLEFATGIFYGIIFSSEV